MFKAINITASSKEISGDFWHLGLSQGANLGPRLWVTSFTHPSLGTWILVVLEVRFRDLVRPWKWCLRSSKTSEDSEMLSEVLQDIGTQLWWYRKSGSEVSEGLRKHLQGLGDAVLARPHQLCGGSAVWVLSTHNIFFLGARAPRPPYIRHPWPLISSQTLPFFTKQQCMLENFKQWKASSPEYEFLLKTIGSLFLDLI